MSGKIALKGFCGARVWPITANTATTYTTGEMVALDNAQNLTKDVTRGEYTIYADDSVYDTGSEYQYEDLTFTVAELPLEIEAELSGGTYNDEEKTYTFKSGDVAPEFAFGYAALMVSGEYRMFKHYCVKLTTVKVDHATKGDTNDIAAYNLTFRSTQRKADGAVRITKDSEDQSYTWLNTIDNIPVSQTPES